MRSHDDRFAAEFRGTAGDRFTGVAVEVLELEVSHTTAQPLPGIVQDGERRPLPELVNALLADVDVYLAVNPWWWLNTHDVQAQVRCSGGLACRVLQCPRAPFR